MQAFKRNFLQHQLAVVHWMQTRQARGGMDPLSLALEVEHAGQRVRFYPQFVVEGPEGQLAYVARLQSGVSGFVGWRPYFNKRWDHAANKLAFKNLASRTPGLHTPHWGAVGTAPAGDYLVKSERSTFGQGMRGPYAAGTPVTLAPGEYWEAFIRGQVVKAWYWDGRLAVVERIDMPQLGGDGTSTVARLAAQQLGAAALQQKLPPGLLAVQGLALGDVPAAGRSVQAEYRYISALNPANTIDHNVREQVRGTAFEQALAQAGQACWHAMPDELRAHTAFTLDGVLDAQGRLWLLEINCNPQLHPAFYEHMLDGLFAHVPQPAPQPAPQPTQQPT